MSFHVIPFPKTSDQELADAGKEILYFAKDNGVTMDAQGFLAGWASGCRVLVERDADKKIITLAIAAIGPRWVRGEISASILLLLGQNPDKMIDFVKTITQGTGGVAVYNLDNTPVYEDEKIRQYTVTEYRL